MSKPGRKIVNSQPPQDRREWQPLPPPRKNQPLLAIAGVLVAAWIAFLLYLALGT